MPPHARSRIESDLPGDQAAGKPAPQQPAWPDPGLLDEVQRELLNRPALVPAEESAHLADLMAAVARREAVALQGGDCAELFEDAAPSPVHRKLEQLYDLSATLREQLGMPVVTMGRMAGQYAKPRSSDWEHTPGGEVLAVYRGDAVNAAEADAAARVPDARRLLAAHDCAAATLKVIRESWQGRADGNRVFAAHELLLLPYELPQVRADPEPYASSLHFGWIGDRTREPDGAHVALAASVRNPVGVKVGPSTTAADLVRLARILNPERRPGRLTFIARMGADRIDPLLPPLVEAVSATGIPVAWISDPMHGNTTKTGRGRKTRSVQAILDELTAFVRILRAHGAWPGGLHLEMTPEPVTECVARSADARTAALNQYRSPCDPRLNAEQAADVVDAFVALLRAA
ncbi:3-deoxy-7-phosphoheptulonate synthase [Streptomyces sp. 6N223]|uniref:3-deoxy-7-phosphoheptulonate synthase n=1 Tax=Streptomyces sp. 6N223 TaxID=3457412 RepID=UPI003FD2DA21